MRNSLILACLALGACAAQPITVPDVKTVEVQVKVPVKCATGDRPTVPVNKYGRLPKGTGVDYAIEALKGDRAAWQTYGTTLAAATAGCWDEAPTPK